MKAVKKSCYLEGIKAAQGPASWTMQSIKYERQTFDKDIRELRTLVHYCTYMTREK